MSKDALPVAHVLRKYHRSFFHSSLTGTSFSHLRGIPARLGSLPCIPERFPHILSV